MNKTILTIVSIIVITTAIIIAFLIYRPKESEKAEIGAIELAEEEILDDCTDEYEKMQNEIIQTNSGIVSNKEENEEQYLVKNNGGKITIYRILEDGSEEEYETTDISVEYLTETDKVNLQNGIKVFGRQELNQLIEDFE